MAGEQFINRSVFKLDGLGSEILQIAVPAAMALAADPLASLVDTVFIGRLGTGYDSHLTGRISLMHIILQVLLRLLP